MKPICASWTANVKVNEGFWSRAAENIYSANFTVKFPLCRNGKWNWSYYDRHVRCLRYMLRDPTFYLIYRHTLVLISALFNAFLVADLLSPYFMSPLSCHSSELFVTRVILRRTKSFQIFNCKFTFEKIRFLLDFSISVRRSNLYFILHFTAFFPVWSSVSPPFFLSHIRETSLSSWFECFRSQWHKEEVLSLRHENTWYLSMCTSRGETRCKYTQ